MASPTLPAPVAARVPAAPPWSIDAARALYNIEGWGAGYFDVSDGPTQAPANSAQPTD